MRLAVHGANAPKSGACLRGRSFREEAVGTLEPARLPERVGFGERSLECRVASVAKVEKLRH